MATGFSCAIGIAGSLAFWVGCSSRSEDPIGLPLVAAASGGLIRLFQHLPDNPEITMAASTFERAMTLVLQHEGGWSDDPADPGGATNLGVTIGTLSLGLGRPATREEVRALTPASVAPLYRRRFWDAIQGDALPAGLDYALFDFAVNSGPRRAVIGLQRVLSLADDGRLGPVTLAALHGREVPALIEALCDGRLAFLRALSTWPRFGRGWARRVAEVRAAAPAFHAAPDRPAAPIACPACGKPVAA